MLARFQYRTAESDLNFPVYFDVGVAGDSLEMNINLVGSSARLWNILVTQLACTDPWRSDMASFRLLLSSFSPSFLASFFAHMSTHFPQGPS